ncbi:U1 small nuclear ribonucleoprotein 70 kDa-like [Eupeodes corollae]|uniref:U1 small nuclear ribonucleoprotein 70 kDa-like n=1 Tax=Eupeodes corollae TaxID=290404 RepID=UPI00248FE059|nr:U1 small nuclear ribonucleoprotein 70 kDa-like [Eupeodes corollae]
MAQNSITVRINIIALDIPKTFDRIWHQSSLFENAYFWYWQQVAYKLEREIATWDPQQIAEATEDPFKTLFVARVNYDTSESKLRREFEVYGPIKKIIMITDMETGKPRGYAFIEYEHERDMHSAYKHADGKKIDGKRVLVDVERARTVKGWLPRRLGGGLGGTRRGGADVNIKHSGREDNERERERYRLEREREDRGGDRGVVGGGGGGGPPQPRFDGRRRSRSRDRRERERSRHRSRSRERRKRVRGGSRDREYDDRAERRGAPAGGPGMPVEKERERERERERDRERKKKRSKSRERERDRSDKKRDRRDRERGERDRGDRETKERKPDFRDDIVKIKEEPIDDYPSYSIQPLSYPGIKTEDDEVKYRPPNDPQYSQPPPRISNDRENGQNQNSNDDKEEQQWWR